MPRRALRSRSLRRVKKRVAGSRIAIHYAKRRPSPATCSNCGAVLAGVPRARIASLHHLPRNQRRPNRPFAGVLCMSCLKKKLINEVRINV